MKELFSLEGKKFIITGAASGIGRETSKLLHELGAELLLLDVNCIDYVPGGGTDIVQCDLTDFENMKPLIQNTGMKYNGLVHCAGVPSIVPLRALDMEEFERVSKINVEAGLNLAKIFSSRQVRNPDAVCSIVFISSVYGVVGSPCNAAYSASKAAIIGITKSLALELAPQKIRVNCIAPGFIRTGMDGKINHLFTEEHSALVESMHPLGMGTASDAAGGIAFLLSDAARWITGSVLNIDGGFTAG